MDDTTKAKAATSEEEGKNSDKAKAEGDGTQTDKTADAPKFTQDDLNRIAAQTRKEEQEKARRAKEKEDREREEAKAKEQGEFQKLADGYKQELDALKPAHEAANSELAAYRATVAEIVAADLKALPDKVRAMAPAKYAEDKALANPLDVLAWLPQAKDLAAELDAQPARKGPKEDPKPKGAPGEGERDRKAAAQARQPYRSL